MLVTWQGIVLIDNVEPTGATMHQEAYQVVLLQAVLGEATLSTENTR